VPGANGKPIMHANVKSTLTSFFLQGKTVSGTFKDGERDFTLKDTNSYFYPLNRKGSI